MWTETVGQEKPINQLRKLAESRKLPHALLFHGPEGIGKRRVALGLAQRLLCTSEATKPCEQCTACQKVARLLHPDCHLIAPVDQTIKIEIIRELRQKATLHPLEGTVKIFLIDEAETMTEAAANALLKILEEPAVETYFFVITATPSRLLPTIRSRCHAVSFAPLSAAAIRAALEKTGKNSDEAKKLSEQVGGSLGKALTLDWQRLAAIQAEIGELTRNRSAKTLLEKCETWSESEEDCKMVLETIAADLHQKILDHQDPKTEQQIQKWQVLQRSLNNLAGNANRRLLLEATLLQVL